MATNYNEHEIRIGQMDDDQVAALRAGALDIYPTLEFQPVATNDAGEQVIPFLVPDEAAMND